MKTGFAVIGFVVVALVVGTCVACTEDENSLGHLQLVSHEWDEEDGGQDYDQWNNEDRNRNRNRNRGSFSPGPFDDSPIDMRNACISLDCSGREPARDEPPPPEQGEPQ